MPAALEPVTYFLQDYTGVDTLWAIRVGAGVIFAVIAVVYLRYRRRGVEK